jgi:hypothetical protein
MAVRDDVDSNNVLIYEDPQDDGFFAGAFRLESGNGETVIAIRGSEIAHTIPTSPRRNIKMLIDNGNVFLKRIF